MIHKYWQYHQKKDDDFFKNYDLSVSKCGITELEKLFSVKLPIIQQYEEIVIYIYKGRATDILHLDTVSRFFTGNNVQHAIFHTLFVIPPDKVQYSQNRFNKEYSSLIEENMTIAQKNDLIHLCYDLPSSIWNKYTNNILYLPPPLIKNNIHQKKRSNKTKLTIGLDLLKLDYVDENRSENLAITKSFISHLLKQYKDVDIYIKISNSKFVIDPVKYKFFIHPRIKLFRFLSNEEYIAYIDKCDIYCLLYSPKYYKNKSSGHFVELIAKGCQILTTRGTFFTELIDKHDLGACYTLGNLNELNRAFDKLYSNFKIFSPKKELDEDLKKYIASWNSSYFWEILSK